MGEKLNKLVSDTTIKYPEVIVMAYIVMAYNIVTTYIVMACIIMLLVSDATMKYPKVSPLHPRTLVPLHPCTPISQSAVLSIIFNPCT